jgi:rubrerythrin
MNHDKDYDRDHDREDQLTQLSLKEFLMQSMDKEEELMRAYLITADRTHGDEELKACLEEFAEGNAKRSQQLWEEIKKIH